MKDPSRKDGSAGGASGSSRHRSKIARAHRKGVRRARVTVSVDEVLESARRARLAELFKFWGGVEPNGEARDTDEMRRKIKEWMVDPERIEARFSELGRRMGAVVENLARAPLYQRSWQELTRSRSLAGLTEYDLEACVSGLERRGIVIEGKDRRFERFGDRVLAIPHELGDGFHAGRRKASRGVFGILTLRGHLDQAYSGGSARRVLPAQRVRELYKMYAQETASVSRIERLPEGVRGLVEKVILEFGGVLPRPFFERMDTDLPHWNGRRWRMILEQSLVGTVQDVDLTPYGIQLQDETLVVFNEVSLAWLRRVAVPGDPDRPHEELSLGIDVVSNVSRFLDYIEEHDVRFTVRGEIFKTTEKRILQHLIPNPGRELSREDVLSFVFRFAKRAELIARTGERTFKVTTAGREWSEQELGTKQERLLDFAREDTTLPGEPLHHARMRAILVRLLRRIEPGTWYDLMYLPFLARNTYLSSLDEELADERNGNGHVTSLEDPQRLAWNLVRWVRERLYLLGIVDLGYDAASRPVALRLTSTGARLLGLDDVSLDSAHAVGSLVVTPDFEVVLFPTGDDGELVHGLDHFCAREKRGSILHFRITQEGVLRALRGGMPLEELVALLDRNSRTPVPQNVTFSIRDWARRAGLLYLSEGGLLTCEDPDTLRRLKSDPGVRGYLTEVIDERTVRLGGRATPRRMRSLLRELGFLVDLDRRAGRE